ncbi:LysR family transcriptional regulator [Catenovulum sp. SM1970]|uniref:LysR family transcriptional regulator n=1 Tax=Marinifaba aquimaris TaxID=2741323 RepID=UPI001572B7F4|nr:LysR family transcriptional regulator [Marinifaba aquimaris]NTS77522.1 LysR family transcriptional regulator [Marinifaba aquimaris]
MANLDLNLMVMFDVIMQEQSITAAAERLAMTQPSVSNAVSRMRHVWQDPLFVKHGRGIRPTPFAQQLWQDIAQPLQRIKQAAQPQHFSPDTLERTFRIAVTDWMADFFWLPLKHIIEKEAPNVNIHAVPYTVNGETLLMQADVDMVLDYFEGHSNKVQTEHLFNNHFVCAMRPEHPIAKQNLTLARFTKAQHLLLSLSGDASGAVDAILQKKALTRRIAMTVNHCYSIPKLLCQTNLITTIPLPIIANSVDDGELIIKALPFDLPPGPISMTWHIRHQRDPAVLWLRNKVKQVLNEQLSHKVAQPIFD